MYMVNNYRTLQTSQKVIFFCKLLHGFQALQPYLKKCPRFNVCLNDTRTATVIFLWVGLCSNLWDRSIWINTVAECASATRDRYSVTVGFVQVRCQPHIRRFQKNCFPSKQTMSFRANTNHPCCAMPGLSRDLHHLNGTDHNCTFWGSDSLMSRRVACFICQPPCLTCVAAAVHG